MRRFAQFLKEATFFSDDSQLSDQELEKYSEYSNDGHPITVIQQDNYHDYQYVDGVLYELSGKNETIVPMGAITAMEENPEYLSQIEKYKDYIQKGGIIETFPVHHIKPSADEFIETMYDTEGFDLAWEFAKEHQMKWEDLNKLLEDYIQEWENERENNPVFVDLQKKVEKYIDTDPDLHEYNLRDNHHRFWALDSLGKSRIYIEIIG